MLYPHYIIIIEAKNIKYENHFVTMLNIRMMQRSYLLYVLFQD